MFCSFQVPGSVPLVRARHADGTVQKLSNYQPGTSSWSAWKSSLQPPPLDPDNLSVLEHSPSPVPVRAEVKGPKLNRPVVRLLHALLSRPIVAQVEAANSGPLNS